MKKTEIQRLSLDVPNASLLLPHEQRWLQAGWRALDIENLASSDRMAHATETGNSWHDNPAYDSEVQTMAEIDRRAKIFRGYLKEVIIIDYPTPEEDEATLGSRLTITDTYGMYTADLVGQNYHVPRHIYDDESHVALTLDSPLGDGIFGKRAGEKIIYVANGQNMSAHLIAIDQTAVQDMAEGLDDGR